MLQSVSLLRTCTPGHGTIATRRTNNRHQGRLLQVLLLARETGLLRLGTVSIDGTKIDANACKFRSVRYDRARQLRTKLASDIAALMAQAEAADTETHDPQAPPKDLSRREALRARLDAARARMEADVKAEADAARPAYEAKRTADDAKTGRRGRPAQAPRRAPARAAKQPDPNPNSALMRRSDAHKYRQAYNAQTQGCADGSQLVLATKARRHHGRRVELCPLILGMQDTTGLPTRCWPTPAMPVRLHWRH